MRSLCRETFVSVWNTRSKKCEADRSYDFEVPPKLRSAVTIEYILQCFILLIGSELLFWKEFIEEIEYVTLIHSEVTSPY